jgi:hypothetical protein
MLSKGSVSIDKDYRSLTMVGMVFNRISYTTGAKAMTHFISGYTMVGKSGKMAKIINVNGSMCILEGEFCLGNITSIPSSRPYARELRKAGVEWIIFGPKSSPSLVKRILDTVIARSPESAHQELIKLGIEVEVREAHS